MLIPAALGGLIHQGNADSLNCRLVLEGANSPTTPAADEILAGKGITVIPDVMANAGGVVVSYFEWVQNLQHFRWDEREVNERLANVMRRAWREVNARAEDVPLRIAAYELGIERVVEAARTRGYIWRTTRGSRGGCAARPTLVASRAGPVPACAPGQENARISVFRRPTGSGAGRRLPPFPGKPAA